MRTPGYTAEAALEATGSLFRTVGGRAGVGGDIQAAAIPPRSCMARCLASQGDDPFAYYNCHCVCFGKPGKTCFPM